MERECCGNCQYFNGEPGDREQVCDERGEYVNEYGYCYKHIMNQKEQVLVLEEE